MMKLMIDDLYPTMPWEKIDTVVFDVGNVLLRYIPQQIMEELLPDRPDLYPVLLDRVFASPYWAMIDRGAMTIAEAAVAMAGRDESLLPVTKKIMFGWWDLKPVSEGVEALRAVKAQGKKLYVLSNYNAEAFAHVRQKYDFFDLFDGMVISSDTGMTKPDPAIYRLLTDRFGIDPARTLFIDDNYFNIESALHCGWQGFLFNHPGKLHDFICAK